VKDGLCGSGLGLVEEYAHAVVSLGEFLERKAKTHRVELSV